MSVIDDSITAKLNIDLSRIVEARHHDPFQFLGCHIAGSHACVRVFYPRAKWVKLEGIYEMQRIPGTDCFHWQGDQPFSHHYKIVWEDELGIVHQVIDPYSFLPQLSDDDLYLFGEGKHLHVWRMLGARCWSCAGISGVLFAVWAPNAERVSVVGDFNQWDGRTHAMRVRGSGGVWEIFIPGLAAGDLYKFEIRNRATGEVLVKTDPYGRSFQMRPNTASIVDSDSSFVWQDQNWMQKRAEENWLQAPLTIYEVHLGSWQKNAEGKFLTYGELAEKLIPYVLSMGFNAIELLPITEHPLDDSWGYQATGYFAPTSRFGTPDDFRGFMQACHLAGIRVLLDWVPGHFPKDRFALAWFDGTGLYEYADPRKGEHKEWGTLVFNYGRNEVRNFLLSSALFWLDEFHIDGLRVDAVASMLYLDYDRSQHQWVPNQYGGREHEEAVEFLKQLNIITHEQHPGVLVIAEESTSWPQVSRPTWQGGLGFSMKWNMGWMNDTLSYIATDPVHRKYRHNQLTFGQLYNYTENFVLPFSHDEVVHGKKSLIYKMPGDDWQRFANLRLLYALQYSYPGKKLLFMGCEFAQTAEWSQAKSLDWYLLQYAPHEGIQRLVRDLNKLYTQEFALHGRDFESDGFEWIDCNDADRSTLSYCRKAGEERIIVALNFTPVIRKDFIIPISAPGNYQVIFSSDSHYYGGTNHPDRLTQSFAIHAEQGRDELRIDLPPLAGLFIKRI